MIHALMRSQPVPTLPRGPKRVLEHHSLCRVLPRGMATRISPPLSAIVADVERDT